MKKYLMSFVFAAGLGMIACSNQEDDIVSPVRIIGNGYSWTIKSITSSKPVDSTTNILSKITNCTSDNSFYFKNDKNFIELEFSNQCTDSWMKPKTGKWYFPNYSADSNLIVSVRPSIFTNNYFVGYDSLWHIESATQNSLNVRIDLKNTRVGNISYRFSLSR